MDFANPKALAEYIIELDNDPAEYLSYFWWKSYYSVRTGAQMQFTTWCELCRMLNNPDEPEKVFNDYEDTFKCSEQPWEKNEWSQSP